MRRVYTYFFFILLSFSFSSYLFAQPEDRPVQDDVYSAVDSLNSIAHNYRLTNPKLSLEFALKAYQLCQGIDYKVGMAASLHNMGTAKALLGQLDNALRELVQASQIREEMNDYPGLVYTYNNIGHIYSELANDTKALEFYERALTHQELASVKGVDGIIYNNIGSVYMRAQKFDAALSYFNRALNYNRKTNDRRGESSTLSNIGLIYHSRGDYKKALQYHLDAYEMGKNQNDRVAMTAMLRSIAEAYFSMNLDAEATNYALRSMLMANEFGLHTEKRSTAAVLARIYERRGRYKEATKYYKLESELKDSLFFVQRSDAVERIQAAYEIESELKENEYLRKEQEVNQQVIKTQKVLLLVSVLFIIIIISLLVIILWVNNRMRLALKELTLSKNELSVQKETIQQKVVELDEKNDELESINSLKNKLFSVIAHDLKNPFNSIIGYSELLVNSFNNYTDNEVWSFVKIIHDSGVKGSGLLENLLQWSRLQTRTIQFLPVTNRLSKLIFEELYFFQPKVQEKNIYVEIDVNEGLEVFGDSNMLKTIIRNLFSNALKFTPSNGVISIKALSRDSHVLVCVSDTGQGIEPHIKEKLFTGEAGVTTANEMGEKGTGLGLILCKDFITKHNGEIWVESKPGEGASFFFSLPHQTNSE